MKKRFALLVLSAVLLLGTCGTRVKTIWVNGLRSSTRRTAPMWIASVKRVVRIETWGADGSLTVAYS